MTTNIFGRFTKCSSIILKILNGTISWCTISRQYQLLYRQDSLKSKIYLLKPAGATNQLEDNYIAGNIKKLKKKLCIHGFLGSIYRYFKRHLTHEVGTYHRQGQSAWKLITEYSIQGDNQDIRCTMYKMHVLDGGQFGSNIGKMINEIVKNKRVLESCG